MSGTRNVAGRIPGHYCIVPTALVYKSAGGDDVAIADFRLGQHDGMHAETVAGTDARLSQNNAERGKKIAVPDVRVMAHNNAAVAIIGVPKDGVA